MAAAFAPLGAAMARHQPHFIATALAGLCLLSGCVTGAPRGQNLAGTLDTLVPAAMTATGARGVAIAVVSDGKVTLTKTYGVRNAAGDPLAPDTIMYGASLTKAAFGYFVMQLVDEGKLDLDTTIDHYLPQPLPSYDSESDADRYVPWAGLAEDGRWRKITPRMLLTHSAGFHNFAFLEPDGKLRIHFDPGERYAYSGAGILLLQFVLERGLGLDVGAEMQRRIFDPQGMTRTSLIWRTDFRPNLADGFGQDGQVEEHDERSKVRASGSMDTTIEDMGKLAAAYVRGDRLSPKARQEMVKGQLPISTKTQFPSLQTPLEQAPFPTLSAGLGVIAFNGLQGPGFYKGGHNDTTGNTWVCLEAGRKCVVLLANDVRAEAAFPAIVQAVLGETGVPWAWEYGDMKFFRPSAAK